MKYVVSATFQGANNSLGYLTGAYYQLSVEETDKPGMKIVILPLEGKTKATRPCGYSSFKAFLKNWKDITVQLPDKPLVKRKTR
jgi:hypothetical protein